MKNARLTLELVQLILMVLFSSKCFMSTAVL
jgi:hypothetical protein